MARGACVAGDVHGRGTCVAGGMHGWGGHAWLGMCKARGACVAVGCAWQGEGTCMAREACVVGVGRGHAWQERWPLQRTVHILLECILVELCLKIYDLWRHPSPSDKWLDVLIGGFMSNN